MEIAEGAIREAVILWVQDNAGWKNMKSFSSLFIFYIGLYMKIFVEWLKIWK